MDTNGSGARPNFLMSGRYIQFFLLGFKANESTARIQFF
jgi:hypothetical protein